MSSWIRYPTSLTHRLARRRSGATTKRPRPCTCWPAASSTGKEVSMGKVFADQSLSLDTDGA